MVIYSVPCGGGERITQRGKNGSLKYLVQISDIEELTFWEKIRVRRYLE